MKGKSRHKRKIHKQISCILALSLVFIFELIMLVVLFGKVQTVNVSDEVIEAGTEYESNEQFFWLGKDITKTVTKIGRVDVKTPGTYKLSYICLIEKYEKTVTVVDTQAPEITLNGETEMVLTSMDDFEEPGFTAIDKCDGDLTNQVMKTRSTENTDNGVYCNITYSVEDSSGNQASAVRKIKLNKGTVYLTFDDGPSSNVTPRILETLAKYNVKATFFVCSIEGDSSREDLVKQEVEAGHTIALHGVSHEYKNVYSSLDATVKNFLDMQEQVERVTGIKSTLIRFPGGSSNTVSKNYTVGIMTEATKKMEELGFTYFDWNVDSDDAGSAKTTKEIYGNVIYGIKEGRANIVLMHDSGGHSITADALDSIIEWCLQEGYSIEALESDSPTAHHGVNN